MTRCLSCGKPVEDPPWSGDLCIDCKVDTMTPEEMDAVAKKVIEGIEAMEENK